MIAPQDLRIHNWILVEGRPTKVWVLIEDSINDTLNMYIEPVPLTPEILEKCGFVKDTESQYGGWLSPSFNDEQLRIRRDEFGFYYQANESCSPIYISSLHWLQNFFYFRTGTELTITI